MKIESTSAGLALILALAPGFAVAFDPPANSTLVVEESFDQTGEELGKGWTVQNGTWIPRGGILEAREVEADNHAASARKVVETGNAVYQVKFRLNEGSGGFHLGFDPKRGSLDKKGHLFSVMIQPNRWRIMKHLDKNRPEEDPNEVIAQSAHSFEIGKWYTLRVTTWGTTVKAMVDDLEPLSGSHPTFGVPKPTVVFRAIASGVDLDDLKVWVPES
jgi:hypothetical protein